MAADPDDTAELGIDLDEAAAREAADRMAKVLETAFAGAAERISRTFSRRISNAITSSLKKAGAGIDELFSARQAVQAAEQAAAGVGKVAEALQDAGQSTSIFNGKIEDLEKDLAALVERSEGVAQALRAVGGDPRALALLNREMEKLLDLQNRIAGSRDRLAKDKNFARSIAQEFQPIKTALIREQGIAEAAIGANKSAHVTAEQQITTITKAETARRTQLEVQAAQATSRRRIELARFTYRQILFLERQLSKAIGSTLNLAGQLGRGVAAGLGRVTGIFRRGDASLNEGLQSALSQRERALADSSRRQERIARNTVAEQSRLIQQLEERQRRGFAGLLSGRSQLSAALGVGGLLGGGLLGGGLLSGGLERFTSLERINIQLDRLTGSATKTKDVLDDLVELARQTPLELTDLSQTAVGLLAAGTGIKQLVPFVESLADAIGFTGGGAEQLQRVSLAIRQIASIGRLQGEELRQLAESLPGLNIPQLLADQLTGGNTSLLLKMSEAGETSASEFSKAFSAALSSDPRIVGAATATVNTLGGQIAILAETFDTLGAAVIGALQPFLIFSIQGTTRRLEFFTRLIQDDTNPSLILLRKTLIGVVAALAGLAALKVAGEALQFLALGVKALLTPLGLLIATFAAIGGAVALLREINPVFRGMTDRLAGLVTGGVIDGVSRLGILLADLGNTVASNALPILERLAALFIKYVVPALETASGLIIGVLLPAMAALASFVASNFMPVLNAVAGVITDRVVPALVVLGAAVADAFGGDFGGLAAIGARIASALATVGGAIAGALEPVLETVRQKLGAIFDSINPGALVASAIRFANLLGRILGRAITNRTFLQVVEKVAIAAAAIAGAFLLGFATEVVKGLPGAVDAILDGLADVLQAAGIPNLIAGLLRNSITGIISLIAAGAFIAAVVRSFTQLGGKAAAGFSKGLVPGLRSGIAGSFSFLRGLRDPGHAMGDFGRRQAASYQREFDRVMRNNSRLGLTSTLVDNGTVKRATVDAEGLRRVLAEQNRQIVNNAAATGVLYQRTWSNIIRGTGNEITGRWQAIQDRVAQTGGWANVGRVAATTLVTSFGAYLSGAQGGTGGLVGVIAATLTAGAIGGPIAAAVTGLAGAVGIIQSLRSESKEAAAAIDALTTSFLGLESALERSETIAENARKAISDVLGEAQELALFKALPGGFLATFAADVESGEINTAADAFARTAREVGVTTAQLAELSAAFRATDSSISFTNLDKQLADIQKELNILPDEVGTEERRAALERQISALEAVQTQLGKAGTDLDAFGKTAGALTSVMESNSTAIAIAAEQQRVLAANTERANTALGQQAAIPSGRIPQTNDDSLFNKLTLERATETAFAEAQRLLGDLKLSAQDTFDFVKEVASRNNLNIDTAWLMELIGGFDLVTNAEDAATAAIQRYYKGLGLLNSLEQDLADSRAVRDKNRRIQISEILAETDLLGKAFDELNRQRTEAIQAQVDGLTKRLNAAQTAADDARAALTDFITAQYVDSPQALVDDLIGNIGNIGSAIEEAMLQGGVQGEAAMRSALGDFDSQLAAIVRAGVEAGLSGSQITDLLGQVFGAVNEQVGGSGARIATLDFTDGITPEAGRAIIEELTRVLDPYKIDAAVGSIFNAQSEVDRIQAALDSYEAQLEVKVVFSTEQIAAALISAGLDPTLAMSFASSPEAGREQRADDLVSAIRAFNDSTGAVFGNASGQPLTPSQVTTIATTIVGVKDPDQTASAAVGAMSAAAGGTTVRAPVNRNNYVVAGVGTANPRLS